MASFTEQNASIYLFTYKEGLLSKVGHDLKLKVGTFKVDVGPKGAVTVSVDATSIAPLFAVEKGREAKGALKPKDLKTIAGHIQKDVLHTRRFPNIVFQAPKGALSPRELIGTLTLKGSRNPIKLLLRREGKDIIATASIFQPDYGIQPFKALLGAIKVKPDVRVEVHLKDASEALATLTP